MKPESNDRILQGMAYWNEREKGLVELSGAKITGSRHFLKEKLKHYESVRDQYKRGDLTKEERSNRKILKGEIKDMEKALYPNRVERLFHRAFRQLNKIIEKYEIEDKVVNLLNKIPILNKKQDDPTQNYSQKQSLTKSQTQNQAESQTKNQNVRLDSYTTNTQKNDGPVQTNSAIRNPILNKPIRSENLNRENNLKNESLKKDFGKPRHRHRLH